MMEEGGDTVKLRQVKPIVVNDGVNTNYGSQGDRTPDVTSGRDNPAFDLEAGAEDQPAKSNVSLLEVIYLRYISEIKYARVYILLNTGVLSIIQHNTCAYLNSYVVSVWHKIIL
jgi:hypothetical protein